MQRILTELTPECELTTQMYISGLEKEEIAEIKCRASSTINNQLQKAFQILRVKNGRELCRKFYERLSGIEFSFDFSPVVRAYAAWVFIGIFSFSLLHEQGDIRRGRRTRIETIVRVRRI
jgi:hypothetical protein